MDLTEIKVGDVVTLTSLEGPKMTVDKIRSFSAECIWFNGEKFRRDSFKIKSLIAWKGI